ncbi:MAG: ribosome small subunit-dependent GTPase A, partial [Pseudoflavonifractor sp.]
TGMVDEILPRSNEFQRPAVANIQQLVIIAANVNPISDPFLIDRIVSIAENKGCEPILCINKCDLDAGDALFTTYQTVGLQTLRISAETGEGISALLELIAGKVVAFTGNSGVGKSSILNALEPGLCIPVGEVSEKLGRGRHTTRHVELFRLKNGAVVADTPGFAAFDDVCGELHRKEDLAETFREFRPYLDNCQFMGCSHRSEKGCAVLAAMAEGKIPPSRHASYSRLYEQAMEYKEWEHTK